MTEEVTIIEMCSNCNNAGRKFTSVYSGVEMVICKLTKYRNAAHKYSCPDWVYYQEEVNQ